MAHALVKYRFKRCLIKISDHSILIAEDNPAELKIYQKALLAEGYHLVLAESGSSMLAVLKDTAVNLLVTDLNMGPLSGLEALSIIKKKYPALPIIVVSGYYTGMVDNFNGEPIKVEAFFQKPVGMGELKKKICEILKIEKEKKKFSPIAAP